MGLLASLTGCVWPSLHTRDRELRQVHSDRGVLCIQNGCLYPWGSLVNYLFQPESSSLHCLNSAKLVNKLEGIIHVIELLYHFSFARLVEYISPIRCKHSHLTSNIPDLCLIPRDAM